MPGKGPAWLALERAMRASFFPAPVRASCGPPRIATAGPPLVLVWHPTKKSGFTVADRRATDRGDGWAKPFCPVWPSHQRRRDRFFYAVAARRPGCSARTIGGKLTGNQSLQPGLLQCSSQGALNPPDDPSVAPPSRSATRPATPAHTAAEDSRGSASPARRTRRSLPT